MFSVKCLCEELERAHLVYKRCASIVRIPSYHQGSTDVDICVIVKASSSLKWLMQNRTYKRSGPSRQKVEELWLAVGERDGILWSSNLAFDRERRAQLLTSSLNRLG